MIIVVMAETVRMACMGWKLYLDDDADGLRAPEISVESPKWRNAMGLPPSPPDTSSLGPWRIARSYGEAALLISERGLPSFVSFDHDLADCMDGIAVARLMIEIDLDSGTLPHGFAFEVHSGNPVGRANIQGLWESYLGQRGVTRVDPLA